MWAFPEEGSIKMNLEEVYKDYGRFKKRAKDLQKWVCEEFSEEKQYSQYVSHLEEYVSKIDEEVDNLFDELMST